VATEPRSSRIAAARAQTRAARKHARTHEGAGAHGVREQQGMQNSGLEDRAS
jgi:hypothetical protein